MHEGLLTAIRDSAEISEDTEKKLKSAIEEFKKNQS